MKNEDRCRAIPREYMTVGEVAKKMNTTVRTLQYYDKEGILSPSAESGGGRRLYTGKDIIQIHQIQSMKYLGFSLDDIKNRLVSLETPADMADVLEKQAKDIQEKIALLTDSLRAIEALKDEVLEMQSVDFRKYADIIVNLKMKNNYYWVIKHLDNLTMDKLTKRFDIEKASKMSQQIIRMLDTAAQYEYEGINPESDVAQAFAKEFWDTMLEFSDGDMSMLEQITQAGMNAKNTKLQDTQKFVYSFIEPALKFYFINNGINPFEGGATQ